MSRGSRNDLAFVPLPGLKDQAAVFAVTKAGEIGRVATAFVEALVRTSRPAAAAAP